MGKEDFLITKSISTTYRFEAVEEAFVFFSLFQNDSFNYDGSSYKYSSKVVTQA